MKNNIDNKSIAQEADPETIKLVKKEISECLSVSRLKLITRYPFIGTVAMSMNVVPVRDIRVPTMCTDGNTVYADCEFTAKLTEDERLFVFAHEVWHACLTHMLRRQTRDPELFNIATDKEVNYMLKQDGFVPPENLLYPEGDEVGKNAEEIYEMLIKRMKKNAKKQNKNGKSGGNNGGNSTDGQDGGSDSKTDKNGKGGKGGKGGKSGLSGQFDKHIYSGDGESEESENQNGGGAGGSGGNDGEDENGNGNGSGRSDKWGKVGFDNDFRPQVGKDLADRMRETVIGAAQAVERSRGTLPEHISRMVGNYLKPEINWKEELSKFVTKCMGGGRRYWLPPNRRHVYEDVYLQSRRNEKIKVAAIIDTSGSTQGDMDKFVSELNGLVSSFGDFELTLVQCDAEVQAAETYSGENPFESLEKFEVCGGGGTYLTPGFEWLRDNNIEADCIVVFTDGYTEQFTKDKDPGIPTLWVLTSDGCEENIEFGTITKFKGSEKNREW